MISNMNQSQMAHQMLQEEDFQEAFQKWNALEVVYYYTRDHFEDDGGQNYLK